MGEEFFHFSWAEPGESDASGPVNQGFWQFPPICDPQNPLRPAPTHSTAAAIVRNILEIFWYSENF